MAWLRLREHREGFDLLVVVGDPIDDGVSVAAELVRSHVEGFVVVWQAGFLGARFGKFLVSGFEFQVARRRGN